MRFTVPQFIEMETRIIWFLSFRQCVFVGAAAGAVFVLYFYLAKTNFLLYLLISAVLLALGSALAFVKIGGRGLPTILANLLKFSVSPKVFIWQKKGSDIKVFTKEKEMKRKEDQDELPLKIAEHSQLKKLKTRIETKQIH